MDEPFDQGESDPVVLSLLRRIESGDLAATETLITRFQDRVFRFFLHYGCDYHDARDLTQDALIAAVSGLAGFDPHRSRFQAWLFGICRNTLLAWKRSVSRRVGHLERYIESRGLELEQGVAPELVLDDPVAESNDLERYLVRLPRKQREAMELVVSGLSTGEISKQLRISVAGARRRIRIAMRKIRALWQRDHGKEP